MTQSTLNWGIIGTGAIARTFARGLAQTDAGQLVAVGSRSQASADAFAKEVDLKGGAYASYDALLADDAVDAVYIATPHPWHAQWTIRAAEAGRHVLCEKPAALNHAEAMAMVDAAHQHNVFLMEAFMYRCHPQTARLVELVRDGRIGELRMIQVSFGFGAGFNPDSRLFNRELGGGGIMDVGCYPVSLARLLAGAAVGAPFADPVDVVGSGLLAETGVDVAAAAVLRFDSGILAQVSTSTTVAQDNVARLYGSEGVIEVPNPWSADRNKGGRGVVRVQRKGEQQAQELVVETDRTAFALEAEVVARAVAAGQQQAESPAMSWADTLGNMATLDRWRAAVGVVYAGENQESLRGPLHGEPLRKPAQPTMRHGQLEGLAKPVSRMVMGVDNQATPQHGAVMFDAYYEAGGNTFDTAYIYGGGRFERHLGWWLKQRGVRDDVVLIVKGAHTPHCNPQAIPRQLEESLDRLQTDYADIYFMHRDNPDVPVGEFVDVLNEQQRAGRIGIFGGSNWTKERIDEANAYAASKGLSGFTVLSNNFSLARMVEPVWAGCVAASDPEYRAWLEANQMPVLAWSSQARGFFTERADLPADAQPDKSLVQSWYSEDNFQRRERAIELAKRKGVRPINIAAAYVLNQPFPTFPLIGPRTLEELRTSLPALEVELSETELAWLNLEEAGVGA
ncbi:MAG: aldo/keto reductase [Phycisphaeraceae bacterium]